MMHEPQALTTWRQLLDAAFAGVITLDEACERARRLDELMMHELTGVAAYETRL